LLPFFPRSPKSSAVTAEAECPCITMGICNLRGMHFGNQSPARGGV
jgi:hypothetical protein